jgi:hypothetical protein
MTTGFKFLAQFFDNTNIPAMKMYFVAGGLNLQNHIYKNGLIFSSTTSYPFANI